MTIGPDVLFLGPSLSQEEAKQLYPNVIVLPPAGMGDILGAANRYRPHAIGLVDGTFLTNMSVYHKEILYAMEQGIWVLGSSSMGALRAAECDDYGMIGVGGIYDRLVSGEIEDDDEVALTHADRAENYRALSDALVTIRSAIAGAVAAGLLSESEGAALVAVQKERWFPDRRLSSVTSDAKLLGIDEVRCSALNAFMRSDVVDPKREDAIALLHTMGALPKGPIPVADRVKTIMSGVFNASLARDVVVETDDGFPITFDKIRRYALLHEEDYGQYIREARQMTAMATLSYVLNGPPTDEEMDLARTEVSARVGIPEDQIPDFAARNDIDDRGLDIMLGTQALVLRLERSWLGGARIGLITQPFLNALRLGGRYEEVKAAAALQHAAAAGVTFGSTPTAQALLLTQHALGWPLPANLVDYVDEHDLGTVSELLESINVSVKAHYALFGIGLAGEDPDKPIAFEDSEPMMSRGF
jgi:hypothetical protein